MIKNFLINRFVIPLSNNSASVFFLEKWIKSEKIALFVLISLATLSWVPRFNGPLDFRWDGAVYYILGTSLAEGKGYKLLNEPGEINSVQYPPLLPMIIAGHQLILQTSDPTTVGQWMRYSAFLLFLFYVYAVFKLFRIYLSLHYAFLASCLCILSLYVYFLSDLCFPEILFSLTTILFVLCNRKEKYRAFSVATYFFAVASYALRTIGLAVFITWILESLIKRRFRQAILRLVLVLIPVTCWQFYISSIESGYAYNHPAYSYQRASYMFYNVTYARNISLDDPFAPEKGKAQIALRAIKNMVKLPRKLGESLVNTYWEEELLGSFSQLKNMRIFKSVTSLFSVLLRYALGLAILVGTLIMLLQRQFIIPIYISINLALICLTPFYDQYLRYLMPIIPFIILSLILFLMVVKSVANRYISAEFFIPVNNFIVGSILIVLLLQLVILKHMFFKKFQPIEYYDRSEKIVKYRLFYVDKSFQDYNICINYIRQNAHANDVVAAGMPHWIYLQTGLKSVMPPFEDNPVQAHQQLNSVPVTYLIIGKDVIGSERYTLPVMKKFTQYWKQVFTPPGSDWTVYQRINR